MVFCPRTVRLAAAVLAARRVTAATSYDVVQRSRPPPVPQAEGTYADVAEPVAMAPTGGVSVTHYADGSVSTA